MMRLHHTARLVLPKRTLQTQINSQWTFQLQGIPLVRLRPVMGSLRSRGSHHHTHNSLIKSSACPRSNNLLRGRIFSPKRITSPSSPFLMTMNIGVHPQFFGASHFAAVRIYSSSRPPNPPRNRIVSTLGAIGAGGMLLVGKGKYILGALKLTKFASLGSMLLTVGAYTAFCKYTCDAQINVLLLLFMQRMMMCFIYS